MAKYYYPATFEQESAGVSVNFPDIECCFTSGRNMAEALEMAADVLHLTLCRYEDEKKQIPTASNPQEINQDGAIVSLVFADTTAYRKSISKKTIKKTLTLPAWINTIAEREGINFSEVLRDALTARLNLQ